jgi:hypothetical protein
MQRSPGSKGSYSKGGMNRVPPVGLRITGASDGPI